MDIMETYLSENSGGKGEGFFCINRINFDKASAILQRVKGSGAIMIGLIGLAREMSNNNYIKRVNYSDLARSTNNMFTANYYCKLKALDVLIENNIIAQNESNATMVNPRFAFATGFNEKTMKYLDGLYKYFKATGVYNTEYNKENQNENFNEEDEGD